VLAAAVTLDGSAVALVKDAPGGGQSLLVGPSAGPVPVRSAAGYFGRPSWGPRADSVLVAADGTRLLLVPRSGPAVRVAAPGLAPYLYGGDRIRAIRLAPDGIRLALVVGSGMRSVLLTGVLRGGGAALASVRAVSGGLTDLTDVGWSREGALVTLAREPGGELVPWEVSSDGATRSASTRSGLPAAAPTQVAATPPDRVLVDAGGTTYQRFFNSWGAPIPDTVAGAAPFYPG
jgi:two-component system sensor histidine kinase MtrB